MTARKTAGPEERLGGDRKINRPGDRLPSDRTTGMVVARAFTAWWTGVRFPPAPQHISSAQRHFWCLRQGPFLPVFYRARGSTADHLAANASHPSNSAADFGARRSAAKYFRRQRDNACEGSTLVSVPVAPCPQSVDRLDGRGVVRPISRTRWLGG